MVIIMKKILCNKIDIVIFVSFIVYIIYIILFVITYLVVAKTLGLLYANSIVIPVMLIISTITNILCINKRISKYGKYIYIENNTIIYNEEIKIPLLLLKEIVYIEGYGRPPSLNFYLINDNDEMIYISKRITRKIEKELTLEIKYDINGLTDKFKDNCNSLKLEIKQFIKKHYLRILLAILGLVLTILSFYLNNIFNKNIILIIILSILCFICGFIQLYFLYISEEQVDHFTRVFLSIFFNIFIIFIGSIFFVSTSNPLLNEDPSIYCMFYAIFLFPSFVTIIILIIFILFILSYA